MSAGPWNSRVLLANVRRAIKSDIALNGSALSVARGSVFAAKLYGHSCRLPSLSVVLVSTHIYGPTDDSRVPGEIFAGQIRGGIRSGVDSGRIGLKLILPFGDIHELRVAGNISIGSAETRAAVAVRYRGVESVIERNDRGAILVVGIAQKRRIVSDGVDDVIFYQHILIETVSDNRGIRVAVWRADEGGVDEHNTLFTLGNGTVNLRTPSCGVIREEILNNNLIGFILDREPATALVGGITQYLVVLNQHIPRAEQVNTRAGSGGVV